VDICGANLSRKFCVWVISLTGASGGSDAADPPRPGSLLAKWEPTFGSRGVNPSTVMAVLVAAIHENTIL
jgi:hypothetical protein